MRRRIAAAILLRWGSCRSRGILYAARDGDRWGLKRFFAAVLISFACCHGMARASEPPPDFLLEGREAGAGFGRQLAGKIDLNGDRYADLVYSAPLAQSIGQTNGTIFVHFGSAAGVKLIADQRLDGIPGFVEIGYRLAGAGDINGDRFEDLLAVAFRREGQQPESDRGELLIFFGSPEARLKERPDRVLQLGPRDQLENVAIAGLGDLDGDGIADFGIGIADRNGRTGMVEIYFGSNEARWPKPDWTYSGNQAGELFGYSIAAAGDVNGDGIGDLIVGAPKFEGTAPMQGRSFLFLGSASGPGDVPSWIGQYPMKVRRWIDADRDHHFGTTVAGAGDVNGDGFADVLVTANFADHGDVDEGVAVVYLGSPAGLRRRPAWHQEGNRQYACFGAWGGGGGDIDGDGFDDLLVAADGFSNLQDKEGAVFLFPGSPTGPSKSAKWSWESERTFDYAGLPSSGLGDLNGDGFCDFAVSRRHGPNPGDLGAIQVFYGTRNGVRGGAGITTDKPFLRWLDQEWSRLSSVLQFTILASLAALFVAIGFLGHGLWRRRTIILVERRDRKARQQERDRLARDLHDELGCQLSRITLISEIVRRDAGDPTRTQTYSNQLCATARSLRAAMEQLVAGLRFGPDTLEAFIELVSREAERFLTGTALQYFENIASDLPRAMLTPEARREMLPCVREALNNVLRHARANEVWIRVRWQGDEIELEIEDNGVGFDLKSIHRRSGLANLEHRMSIAGGRVSIHSSRGLGTRVVLAMRIRCDGKARIEKRQCVAASRVPGEL